jgi:hypothetical protein
MEESISKAAGADFGEYVSPGEFRAMIRTIGRVPAERTTTYRIRKVFEEPDAEERLPITSTPGTMPMLGAGHAPITGVGY